MRGLYPYKRKGYRSYLQRIQICVSVPLRGLYPYKSDLLARRQIREMQEVSVPLRGLYPYKLDAYHKADALLAEFQSPCGDYTLIRSEEKAKEACKYLNIKFQSPCGDYTLIRSMIPEREDYYDERN